MTLCDLVCELVDDRFQAIDIGSERGDSALQFCYVRFDVLRLKIGDDFDHHASNELAILIELLARLLTDRIHHSLNHRIGQRRPRPRFRLRLGACRDHAVEHVPKPIDVLDFSVDVVSDAIADELLFLAWLGRGVHRLDR